MDLLPVGKAALVHEFLHLGKQAAVYQHVIGGLQRVIVAELRVDGQVDQIQLPVREFAGQVVIRSRLRLLKHIGRILQIIEHVDAGLVVVLVVGGLGQRREELGAALQHGLDHGEVAQRDHKGAVRVVGHVHGVRDTGRQHEGELLIELFDVDLHVLVEGAQQRQEVRARQRVSVKFAVVGGVIIFSIYINIVVGAVGGGIAVTEAGGRDGIVLVVHQLMALAVRKGIVVYLFVNGLVLQNAVLELVHCKAAQVHIDEGRKVLDEGRQLHHEAAAARLVAQVVAHRLNVSGIGILVEVRVAEHIELQLAGIVVVARQRGHVAVEEAEQDLDLRIGNEGAGIGVVITELITAEGEVHMVLGGDLVLRNIAVDQFLDEGPGIEIFPIKENLFGVRFVLILNLR